MTVKEKIRAGRNCGTGGKTPALQESSVMTGVDEPAS